MWTYSGHDVNDAHFHESDKIAQHSKDIVTIPPRTISDSTFIGLLRAMLTVQNLKRLTEVVLFLCPNVLLTALGFGGLGPMVGFVAPLAQSCLGTPLFFRICQSISMGGRAAAGYRKIIRVIMVIFALLAELKKSKA